MPRQLPPRVTCPVELCLAVLGGKWKTVILAHLKQGSLRYAALRARMPALADKVLTERLTELQTQGLVSCQKVRRRGSPATYQLTARGASLATVLQAMYDWGTDAAPALGVTIEAPTARDAEQPEHVGVR